MGKLGGIAFIITIMAPLTALAYTSQKARFLLLHFLRSGWQDFGFSADATRGTPIGRLNTLPQAG